MQAVARSALRRLGQPTAQLQKRMMSGGHSMEENIKEMNKWKYVTFVAIPVCIGMAIYDLSGEHHHPHEQPEYSYLKIKSKEFPWGECPLFDGECWKQKALESANNEE